MLYFLLKYTIHCLYGLPILDCIFEQTTQMKWLTLFILFSFSKSLKGQYYINDLVGLNQSQEKYQLMRKNKIKTIIGKSLEADGSDSPGFSLVQELQTDGKKMITSITNSNTNAEKITNIYELSKLKRTIVNRSSIETKTDFNYNEKGQLNKIVSTAIDSSQKIPVAEIHIWNYHPNNSPKSMLKFGDGIDTIKVDFLLDSSGIVLEEYWHKKEKLIETYYYYYNDKQQLTDIVRFNKKANKLLPDFVYEYNTVNQITNMIQVGFDGKSIVHWNYTYHSNGLRESETAKDKEKNIIGKINFSFEKNQ